MYLVATYITNSLVDTRIEWSDLSIVPLFPSLHFITAGYAEQQT